jgi:hypothetical protein
MIEEIGESPLDFILDRALGGDDIDIHTLSFIKKSFLCLVKNDVLTNF